MSQVAAPTRVAAATYSSTVLGDSPSIYYRLGEASGATAADSSGHGSNATYTGSATLGRPGAIPTDTDTAISTSGQALGYSSTTGLPLGNSARSVEIWFNTTSWSRQTLVNYGQESSAQAFAVELLDQSHVDVRFLSGPSNAAIFSDGRNVADGNWHHLVVTYDGSTFVLYIDAVNVGSQSVPAGWVNTTSAGLVLGCLNSPGDNPFSGRLDEFALYGTALTAAQVTAHFTASGNTVPTAVSGLAVVPQTDAALVRWQSATAVTPSGQASIGGYLVSASAAGRPLSAVAVSGTSTSATLHGISASASVSVQVVAVNGFGQGTPASIGTSVSGTPTTYAGSVLADSPSLYYRFGETSGSIAADASGSGDNSAYVGSASLGQSGVVSGDPDTAMGLSGRAVSCIPCANMPVGDSARSFEVWFKTNNTSREAFFSYGIESSTQAFALELLNPTTLDVRTIDGQDGTWTLPVSVNDGKWHQIAVTYSSPTYTGYLDGSSVGTSTRSTQLATIVLSTGLTSGSLADGSDGFSGALDEFSVYPTALSAGRVSAHYAAATAAFTPVGGAVQPVNSYGGGDYCQSCLSREFGRPFRAEPIDTADGNYWETWTDLSIPGRGFPLLFSRTYNSLAASNNGALGFGWSPSYAASLSVDPVSGNVTVLQENGSQALFNKVSPGPPPTYAPAAPRDIASLVQNGDGTFTFVRHTSDTLTFSSTGQLTSLTDRNGYHTTLTYDGSGHLSSVTDPAGRAVTVHFTGALMTSLSDATGRTVTYGYNDGAGNLTDVTDVNSGNWHYTYDPSHHLLTVRDPRGNVVTTNHYDAGSRVDYQLDGLQRKTTFTYAPDGSSTITADPKGNAIQDTFSSGVRMSETHGYGTPQAATSSYTYDPSTLGVATITDPNGHMASMGYDANGNMVSRTDALGRITTWTYNGFNEPLTVTDPNGVTTTNTYDASGNLQTTSTPLVGSIPAQSQTTTNTYGDVMHPGDVTMVTDANSKQWHRSYDTYGDLAGTVDPVGDTTTYTYNTIGWVQTSVSPRGNVTGGNPSQFTTTYSYADPVTGVVDQFGDVRVVTDPLGHRTTNTYDGDRNVVSVKDGDGNLTQYTFDAAGEKTDVTRADSTVLHTDYNLDGSVKDQVDGASNMTSYGYDPLARVTAVTDPLQHTSSTTYDGAGNRLTVVDAQSPAQTATYTYDAANQLTGISYSDGRTPNVSSIQYDNDGQRTQMTDGTGTSHWTYDSLRRMTSSTNGAGSVVSYGYDLVGRTTSLTYPGNHAVGRVYDDAGRLTSVSDWLTHTTTFTPDPDSNLASQVYPNGTTATSSYNNADQVTSIADAPTANPNNPFASFTYTRDGNGQLQSVVSTGVPADNHSYTYTALNQLHGVDAQSYTYSTADAATQLTSGTLMASDAADQLSSTQTQPITVLGSASGGDTGGSRNLTVTLPAGVLSNDQILVASTQQSGKVVNTPTGYTQVASITSTGSPAANTVLLRKTAAGGETQVAITYGSKFPKSVTVIVYRGVSTSTPIDVQSSGVNAAGTTVTAASLTPPFGGDRLVLFAGAVGNGGATNWTAPTSMTRQLQFAGLASTSAGVFDQQLSAAGASGTRTATINATVQSAAVMIALRPATLTTYAYDTRGNRISVTTPSGSTTTYGYDQANRLTSYGTTATFAYDGDGLRASMTVGGTTDSFTWNVATGLPTLLVDATPSTTTYFVYGAGGAPLEQISSSGSVLYFHHDQLGSTRALTDQTGAVAATFTYDSYGVLTASTGTATTPLLYAGQYRDPVSSLYYLRARYYDPTTVGFLPVTLQLQRRAAPTDMFGTPP